MNQTIISKVDRKSGFWLFLLSVCLCAEIGNFDARTFEQEMLPYVLSRTQKNRGLAKTQSIKFPSQAQLFKVSALWKGLSFDFKAAYMASVEIPAGLRMYRSPGYGIEIYYTIYGIDAVDSTDTWGCSSVDWRMRLHQPNAVPDYIDEVAWAVDSAWSMEVVRFGFKAPYGAISADYPSFKYKIQVEDRGENYGLTYFAGLVEGETGARSLLTIRNQWEGWDINDIVDYESHPEKAIRITCAHELFHAVQFAMVHNVIDNVFLDQFPISWLEATSTLMEDLVFDSVNDYTQYLSAYFNNPATFSFLSQNTNYNPYTNSVLALFLYHASARGIDIIKDIFESNYSAVSSINILLEKASVSSGTTWPDLLNRFHTESFFTGNRADSRFFVPDSPILEEMSYLKGNCKLGITSTKAIIPFGMRTFSLLRPADLNNNTLQVRCTLNGTTSGMKTVLRLILTGGEKDTIISSADINPGSAVISTAWGDYTEAIAVVTNGNYDFSISVSILFSDEPITSAQNLRLFNTDSSPRTRITFRRNAIVVPNGICSVKLYTVTGRLLYAENIAGPAVYELFNSRNVTKGEYFVRVQWKDDCIEKRIVNW